MVESRVLIVSDHLLARAGLLALVDPFCQVVGQVSSGLNLMDDVDLYQPDVVLGDVSWGRTALDSLGTVARSGIPVILLVPEEVDAGTVVSNIAAAPSYGLLLNTANSEWLATTIDAVAKGLIVIDPALSTILSSPAPNEDTLLEELSPREQEVLNLLAQGMTNKAIALHLKITDHTVKFHVNAIMTKLAAQSRTDAVVRATRAGLLIL